MVMTSAHLAIAESMRLMPPELTGPAGPESHTLAGLEHLNVVLAAICSGLIPPVVLFTAGFPVFRLLDRLGSVNTQEETVLTYVTEDRLRSKPCQAMCAR